MEARILEGRTAVVTGASSGIGRAIAMRLAASGVHVFSCGRNRVRLEEVKREIQASGGQATISCFDLTDFAQIEKFVDSAASTTGRMDLMVNAAGIEHPGNILDGRADQWKDMFDTNVIALLVGATAAVKNMRERQNEGHIVNISSAASERKNSKVYGATKHAVNVISASLRDELEQDRIRITNILPGACATNFARNFDSELVEKLTQMAGVPTEPSADNLFDPSTLKQLQSRLKNVLCNPESIADAVMYAISQPIDVNISELTVRPPTAFAGIV